MKKRKTGMLAVLMISILLAGCGNSDSAMKALEERAGSGSKVETEAGSETAETGMPSGEEGTKEAQRGSAEAVLGDECSGYNGFSWLTEEELSKDRDGTGDKLTIFLPKGGSRYSEENHATSYGNGMNITIVTNPYIDYDQDRYSPLENLEIYMEDNFNEFASSFMEGKDFSGIKQIEDGAWQRVDYVMYQESDGAFDGCSEYILLKQRDDFMLLARFEVMLSEATDDTDQILQELASFYGFENEWDSEQMTAFLEDYTSDPGVFETQQVSVGGDILLELPRSWSMDYNFDRDLLTFDEFGYVYAEHGDASLAESYLEFSVAYEGTQAQEVLDEMLADSEGVKDLLVQGPLAGDKNLTVGEQDTACLGKMLFVESETLKDGNPAVSRIYLGCADGNTYSIRLIQLKDAKTDAQVWLDGFFADGQIRRYNVS